MENYPRVAEYVTGDTRMDIIEGSEPRLAETPYNKNQIIDVTLIGATAGLIIGCAGLYLYAITRKSISSKRDIETKLNGDCICEVPLVVKKRSANKSLLRTGHGNFDFSESFRLLKQRVISKSRSTKAKVIGITSASRGEGKTTVAYNLARALSKGTSRILVVDMDLRDRSLQEYLNRKKEVTDVGISDVAAGKVTLNQALNTISDTFDVLFAGSDNTKFRKADYAEIFKALRNMYDTIIVDLSSCDVASETAATADLCDQILFVVKWNGVSCDKITNAIKYMSFSDAGIMGYILNQSSPDERTTSKYHYNKYYYNYGRRYGYGYGYGYGKKSSKYSKYSKPVTETAAITETAAPEAAPNEEK
jgi:Mrp family chromosome partitioning ATPase